MYSSLKIINCLRKYPAETEKAICDAVENVKGVFPQDKYQKPIVNQETIQRYDPVLTITLPTGEIVEIYMEALAHLLSRKENQDLRTLLEMLGSPKAAKQIVNDQLISLLVGNFENPEGIIRRIQEQLKTNTTGDLGSSNNDPTSFKINDLYDWYGTIGQLYTLLYVNNKKNPKIPTLKQIRDGTYQETAEAAAACGTPPQAPAIDPTYTIFNQHQHG